MIDTLQAIIRGALERLSQQMQHDLPPLLAALTILLLAYLTARLVRWLLLRAVKGIQWDRWLRQSGLAGMLDRSGTLRASRVVAHAAYWAILILGVSAALNALSTEVTSRFASGLVTALPRIAVAAAIVIAGLWLGQYLGRSVLIWAVNEDVPAPGKLALATRALIIAIGIVAAADALNFAPAVFLSAFVLVLGGAVLAAGIALGLGASDAVRRHFDRRRSMHPQSDEPQFEERSLWNHL